MGKRLTAVAVAIAAAGSADDDAAQRRRVQYKIYQRQHRARQKNKTLRLEHDVQALAHEITQLSAQLAAARVWASRGTLEGAPARAVAEFYRVFAHGHVAGRAAAQAQFMRDLMAPDVQGPDYTGVETLIDQWALYGSLFQRTRYSAERVGVERFDDVTVVVVDVVMAIQPTRAGAALLYPRVRGDELAIQQLIASPFTVRGSVRFVFDALSAKVAWFGADMDFVGGLAAVLGSATRVSRCVEHARMSLCTGRITAAGEPYRSTCNAGYARRGFDGVVLV